MLHLFRRLCLLLPLLTLVTGLARAQNTAGYGDWQLHLPTNHPLMLADAGDRVYVAAGEAFYFLDKTQNTTQVLSSRDGLHDVGVTAVAYDSVTSQLVVAYRNTNLDIIRANGTVVNVNDILRKGGAGSRSITQIYISNSRTTGNRAYLATTFGLVVLNLDKLEVSDTYSTIGPNGSAVEVYATAVSGTTILAATPVGVLRATISSSVNLLDYRSWTNDSPPGTAGACRYLNTFAGSIYAAVNNSGLFRYQPSSANHWAGSFFYALGFRQLRTSIAGLLTVNDEDGITRLVANGTSTTQIISPVTNDNTMDVVRSHDGSYYVASYETGLLRVRPGSGQPSEKFVANGPATRLGFGVLADARTGTVNIFTGGYTEPYVPFYQRLGFYEYANGQWTNFNSSNYPSASDYPNLMDPSRGVRTPDGTLYVATYDNGLLEWKGPGQFRQFTIGTPGCPILGRDPGNRLNANTAALTDVAADAEGNVWVVNRHQITGISGLYKFTPSAPAATAWQTIPWVPGLENLERIVLDDVGQVWVSQARRGNPGIFVLNPTAANTSPRFLSTADGLPDNAIYDVVKDRSGDIWVGTAQGVATFTAPGQALDGTGKFTTPIVARGEGALYQVLYKDIVKAIAVDGANRKWFGTDKGLWLFSANADEALLHFTTANSPLPSDRIVDIDINDKTGEVWIATDGGVVSYRGSASVTVGDVKCTSVFPNPVRPDFQGTVGLTGVANNGLVKITDVAGHLVYATKAAGGTVTWNLQDTAGRRVRSGVYLVLTSDADGANECVSKIAVLSN